MVLRRPTYHLSEQVCPYCDNNRIRFSDRPTLNILRRLCGSQKRYCPECEAKWRVKTRSSSRAIQEVWIVLIGAGLGLIVFYSFSILRERLPSGEEMKNKLITNAVMNNDQLVDSIAGQLGSDFSYKSAQEIYKLAPLEHKSEAKNYLNKLKNAKPGQKAEMLNKAKGYIERYQGGSADDKRRLIQEARRKLRSMNV